MLGIGVIEGVKVIVGVDDGANVNVGVAVIGKNLEAAGGPKRLIEKVIKMNNNPTKINRQPDNTCILLSR